VAALMGLLAGPAAAVIIATGDGTGNTSAPVDDPGFAHVGIRGGLSGVYLGHRWVLTANHVGVGDLVLGGLTYAAVPGSGHRFANADLSLADLLAFKLVQDPGLPPLALATSPPSRNTLATLVGHGRNRGAATTWNGIDGWLWGYGGSLRWGTNHVSDSSQLVLDTQSFAFSFDRITNPPSGEHEAIAATGDSGGGVFVKRSGSWQLAGILFANADYVGQPVGTALYGNLTYAVDISTYQSEILALTSQPACADGLDDDLDGLVDFPLDPGCASALDDSEHSPDLACDDGVDNDGDGFIDYPADPQCTSPTTISEAPVVPLLTPAGIAWLATALIGGGALRLSSRAGAP
jgi:hypothetical protein